MTLIAAMCLSGTLGFGQIQDFEIQKVVEALELIEGVTLVITKDGYQPSDFVAFRKQLQSLAKYDNEVIRSAFVSYLAQHHMAKGGNLKLYVVSRYVFGASMTFSEATRYSPEPKPACWPLIFEDNRLVGFAKGIFLDNGYETLRDFERLRVAYGRRKIEAQPNRGTVCMVGPK